MPSDDTCKCGRRADRLFCGLPHCDQCYAEFMSRNGRMDKACEEQFQRGDPLKYSRAPYLRDGGLKFKRHQLYGQLPPERRSR